MEKHLVPPPFIINKCGLPITVECVVGSGKNIHPSPLFPYESSLDGVVLKFPKGSFAMRDAVEELLQRSDNVPYTPYAPSDISRPPSAIATLEKTGTPVLYYDFHHAAYGRQETGLDIFTAIVAQVTAVNEEHLGAAMQRNGQSPG
jgi:hypothetical protein